MTDTITIDRPPVAIRRTVRSSTKPATVSASALALHLDCSRTYIGKLEAEGVLHRAPDGDGFDLDGSRVAYLRFLRRERKQSPRNEADADFQRAKSELIRIRIGEKQRTLISLADSIATVDQIMGIVLTHLSGMGARCTRDLQVRRAIDAVIFEIRTEIADEAHAMANERGEPPEELAT